MKLTSLLDPDFIEIGVSVGSVAEAVDRIVDAFHLSYHFVHSKDKILAAIHERESLGGTQFKTGLALPHARFEGFNDVLIGICVPQRPIATEAGPIRFVVVILTEKTGSDLYLQTIAAFTRLSRNKELFDRLCAVGGKRELLSLLEGIEVKKEVTVADIMSDHRETVLPGASVREAADILYKSKSSYLPVVDEKGAFVGEITVHELLRIGIPDYAIKIGSLRFLSSFAPFEEFLRREDSIRIGEVMVEPEAVLEEQSSLAEAALLLTKHKRRHLPVLREGKLVGVLSFMDLLNRVIRG
ncbi:MAG: CBS domain-containing protein [Alkalispirochaeta sp.]|jgi:CBS domain-containing protein